MASTKRTTIRGTWVLGMEGDRQVLLKDRYVVIEGRDIVAVTRDLPVAAGEVMDMDPCLVLPGFVNLHTHLFNGPMLRGIPDDLSLNPYITTLIYGLLMPLTAHLLDNLTEDEVRAILKLGMLDVMKGGSTTIMDVWRPKAEATFFEVADEMGVRVYGTPYIMSTSNLGIGTDGKPVYETAGNDRDGLDRAISIFRRYDQGDGGRIRVALGPHGADTCTPELLRAVRDAATDLGCLINMHLAQTPEEMDLLRDRHDMEPVAFLESTGLLGPDVLLAHCVHLSAPEIGVLADTGTTVVNCPISFARGGINVPYHRFAGRGVRTGIGTDSHGMDLVNELRTAGFFSKLHAQKSDVATAHDLIRAATLVGAEALRRPDLGRIEAGARADLLVVDMGRPHLQPVWDPLKNLIWKGNGADISVIMVDGEILVRDGTYQRGDEREIIAAAAAAAERVWALAAEAGILELPR